MDFKFVDSIVTADNEKFLLHLNAEFQVVFFTIYVVGGAARYLFLSSLRMLSQFKDLSMLLDLRQIDLGASGSLLPAGSAESQDTQRSEEKDEDDTSSPEAGDTQIA